MIKRKDISKVATVRNLSARKSIANAFNQGSTAQICVNARNARIMKLANHAPMSRCSKFRKN